MKLTEKELNEFPIGTKIKTPTNYELIKASKDENDNVWYSDELTGWFDDQKLSEFEFCKVEIPTYIEYIPPKSILDEKEKEYLSFVIRPWKNKIGYIDKRYGADKEWIEIYLKKGDSYTNLPRFKKGTMYKGMELDREYSLEDLGI